VEASEAATQQGEAPAEGGQETAPAPGQDFGPLEQRFDELGSRLERIEGALPQPQEAPAEPADEWEQYLQSLEQEGEPQSPEEVAADDRAAEQQLARMVQLATQNATAPLQREIAEMKRDAEAIALEQTYPDLRDTAKAQQVLDASAEYAQRMGRPDLAFEPGLIELVYKAQRADERAASERPAGDDGVQLEAAAGAAPGEPEDNRAERVVKAAQRNNFWM
jgi:hypothetical protein